MSLPINNLEGLAENLVIDRAHKRRAMNITPDQIDSTLYDAFGQRQDQYPVHSIQPVPRHP